MAGVGRARFNFRDLEDLQRKTNRIKREDVNAFARECAKELAARLLAKVIKRTPVRRPEDCPPGVTGGTLRRGWTAGNQTSASSFVESLQVTSTGDQFIIEINNPVEYAPYVEYGHRTKNHKGWVEGQFMLTISVQEIQNDSPTILQRKLARKMEEWFRD